MQMMNRNKQLLNKKRLVVGTAGVIECLAILIIALSQGKILLAVAAIITAVLLIVFYIAYWPVFVGLFIMCTGVVLYYTLIALHLSPLVVPLVIVVLASEAGLIVETFQKSRQKRTNQFQQPEQSDNNRG